MKGLLDVTIGLVITAVCTRVIRFDPIMPLDEGSQMSRSICMLFSDYLSRVRFLCFNSGYEARSDHEICMKYDSYFAEHSMNRT